MFHAFCASCNNNFRCRCGCLQEPSILAYLETSKATILRVGCILARKSTGSTSRVLVRAELRRAADSAGPKEK